MQTSSNSNSSTVHSPFSAGMSSQPSIIFPTHYNPGTTDNFVSNETIAANITASQIWALLADISKWESYYKNCANITVPDEGPLLQKDCVFKFSTFGFPPLTCVVREAVQPEGGREGRLAWESKTDDGQEIYHAWLVQDLGGRVRVLTQESQIGPVSSRFVFMFIKRVCEGGVLMLYRCLPNGACRNPIRCCWVIRIGWMDW